MEVIKMKGIENRIDKRMEDGLKWFAHFCGLPVKVVKETLIGGFGEMALRGYAIFGYADDIGDLEHIERIDEMEIYSSDIEAGKQAEKDGIKLIPYKEQPKRGAYKYYRYIDNEDNRRKIKEIMQMEV